jgi:hypothetical protein
VTNIREFKKFIDPILKADPDLAFSRGSIFVTPIRHVLRAIAFHPTSWRTGMIVGVEIRLMCSQRGDHPLGFLFVNEYWPRQNYWESNRRGFLRSLHEAINVECLPRLKAAATFEQGQALFEAYYDSTNAHYDSQMAYFHLLAGRFDRIDAILATETGFVQRELLSDFIPEVESRKPDICARLSKKRKREILQYLHEREAQAIRNFKLEKYWRPRPFPAEEYGLV